MCRKLILRNKQYNDYITSGGQSVETELAYAASRSMPPGEHSVNFIDKSEILRFHLNRIIETYIFTNNNEENPLFVLCREIYQKVREIFSKYQIHTRLSLLR